MIFGFITLRKHCILFIVFFITNGTYNASPDIRVLMSQSHLFMIDISTYISLLMNKYMHPLRFYCPISWLHTINFCFIVGSSIARAGHLLERLVCLSCISVYVAYLFRFGKAFAYPTALQINVCIRNHNAYPHAL